MKKKNFLIAVSLAASMLLASCVKAAKDLVEDIDQRAQCVELLGTFTTEGGNQTCAQQISDINKILDDCGEFLTQDQKDELNTAKENCTDN